MDPILKHPLSSVSRRRMLQAAGMAPMALLASQGASLAEQVAAMPASSAIPPGAWSYILGKARTYHQTEHSGPLDEVHFEKAARLLWGYFLAGVGQAPIADKEALARVMFDHDVGTRETSGQLIVRRIGTHSPEGEHMATNACAFLCGKFCADEIDTAGEKIDAAIYATAFDETKKVMKRRGSYIRSAREKKGELPFTGNGC